MNYIKSIFGSGDAKSPLSFDSKPVLPAESVQPSPASVTTLEKDFSSLPGKMDDKPHTLLDTFADTVNHAGSTMKYYITKVVPLEEGDCLSCKLIGMSVLWGGAGFVVIQGIKTRINYVGFRKVAFTIHVGLLSSGLFTLGLARLLDKSIFEKDKGNKKSVKDMALSDLEALQQIFEMSNKDKTTADQPAK